MSAALRPYLVETTTAELALLIRESAGRVLHCELGTGRVDLNASPWAGHMLGEWRGITFRDGAGI